MESHKRAPIARLSLAMQMLIAHQLARANNLQFAEQTRLLPYKLESWYALRLHLQPRGEMWSIYGVAALSLLLASNRLQAWLHVFRTWLRRCASRRLHSSSSP